MTLTSYGAAGGVTGSKHLLDTGSARVLLDCGIFQGPGSDGKNRVLPFDPTSLDAVVISHAHADHTAMLPVLVHAGYRGPIYATEATRDVMRLILLDAAHIASEDAAHYKERGLGDPASWEPAFTPADVARALAQVETIPYARDDNHWHDIAAGVRCKLYDAGHILGSSIVVLQCSSSKPINRSTDQLHSSLTLCFSGDLGPTGAPILRDPEIPREACDALLMETTYGDETHVPLAAATEQLRDAIARTAARGGVVIVPAFSLGRTQLLLYLLHRLTDTDALPHVPIVVDSPLATDLTDLYRLHRRLWDRESSADFPTDEQPLVFPQLEHARSVEESRALNSREGPLIIISASGMMTNGRVVHHLRHRISDPRNLVLITGYQAEGTTGRLLQDGATEVELLGERFPVAAEIIAFDAFSAHADQPQLLAWANRVPGVRHAILVHGENDARTAFTAALTKERPNWRIDQPKEGEAIAL